MRGGADVVSDDNEWPMPSVEDGNSTTFDDTQHTTTTPVAASSCAASDTSNQPFVHAPTDPHVLSIVAEGAIHEKLSQQLDRLCTPELFIDITSACDQEKFVDEAGGLRFGISSVAWYMLVVSVRPCSHIQGLSTSTSRARSSASTRMRRR